MEQLSPEHYRIGAIIAKGTVAEAIVGGALIAGAIVVGVNFAGAIVAGVNFAGAFVAEQLSPEHPYSVRQGAVYTCIPPP